METFIYHRENIVQNICSDIYHYKIHESPNTHIQRKNLLLFTCQKKKKKKKKNTASEIFTQRAQRDEENKETKRNGRKRQENTRKGINNSKNGKVFPRSFYRSLQSFQTSTARYHILKGGVARSEGEGGGGGVDTQDSIFVCFCLLPGFSSWVAAPAAAAPLWRRRCCALPSAASATTTRVKRDSTG